jgi:23S rRNA (cytosine1962-C5)-methyltransferase
VSRRSSAPRPRPRPSDAQARRAASGPWAGAGERSLSAARWRERLFGSFGSETETDAYRLLNGAGDGVPGVLVEAYAGFLVTQVLEEEHLKVAREVESALAEALHPRGSVRKLRYAAGERGRIRDDVAAGETPPDRLVCHENGLALEVSLMGGLHTGLFTDMREERARLRRLSSGRRVLNAFAYSGAFSVAAAAGGASEVTSVDVVAGALERAQRNFRLCGLDPGAHPFARMEVLEFLRMARRRGWRYDAAVLDPPTFSTFRGGRWSARDQYPALLEAALAVLERDALLWAACNTEGLPAERLERQIRAALEAAGRPARLIAVGGLPPDHPTPPDRPTARYLKVYVLQVF